MAVREDGTLDLATFSGLVRFDGRAFTEPDRAATRGRGITTMFVAADGARWLGDQGRLGRCVTVIRDGVATILGPEDGLPAGPIWSITQSDDGTMWIGGGGGLSRSNATGFERIEEIGRATIWTVVPCPGGVRVVSSDGLMRIDGEGAHRLVPGLSLSKHSWAHAFPAGSDGLIVITPDQLIALDADDRETVHALGPDGPLLVRDATPDGTGGWWLATTQGLRRLRIDQGSPHFTRLALETGPLRSVLATDPNGVWIGGDGGGLWRIERSPYERLPYSAVIPRSGMRIRMTGDDSGVWCVRRERALAVRLGRDGIDRSFDLATHGVGRVTAATVGPNRRLWIADRVAVHSFDDEGVVTGRVETSDPVTAMAFVGEDLIVGGQGWIGPMGRDGGVRVGPIGGAIRRIVPTDADRGWAISDECLIRYSPAGAEEIPIPGPLRGLAVAPNGDVWIGSYGWGLHRFRDGVLTRIDRDDGLPDESISHVAIGPDGIIWASTNLGVLRLRPTMVDAWLDGREPRVRTRLFRTGEAHGPNGHLEADGLLTVSTIDGLARIDTVHRPARTPVGLVLDELPARFRPGAGIQATFSVVAIDGLDQLTVRYRRGSDAPWIDLGAERGVLVEAPPPGPGRIEIAVARADEDWVSRVHTFVVERPWYDTTLARILEITAIAAVLTGIVSIRISAAHRRRIRMAKLVTDADESERRRVARELHDDVSQRLAAVAMDLQTGADGPSRARAGDRIRTLASDVHAISRRLHPSMLADLGLATAVASECRRTSETGELDIDADIDPRIPEPTTDAALAVYRVVQEALRNVARHAGASRATVELASRTPGTIHLTVTDDGCGFDVASSRSGLGLASMRERAILVGGRLKIVSTPERGTRIELEVPCQAAP